MTPGRFARVLIGTSLAALTIACHGGALLRGEQYAYRDAAHYYYPLHQRIQQEWSAGRWPLWDASENAGMPLMGNPTAAVLYPGKLIFALVSYPLASRLYIIGHDLLAFAAMFAMLRSWGTGAVGSALGGMAYAFGAPVLFQYSNVIYLVGAAWAPLGMLASDRWARLGDRRALLGLAVVLAMETLGGDPETAYLTVVFAGGYAVSLAILRRSRRPGPWALLVASASVLWISATLAMAASASRLRPPSDLELLPPELPWMPWVKVGVLAAWLGVGLIIVFRWRRSWLAPGLLGLMASAVLGAWLSAAQLLPAIEFAGQTGRVVGEGSHEVYAFSLPPIRVAELLWPNAGGSSLGGNHAWLDASGWAGRAAKVWVPSLYLGGLTVVLALAAIRLRGVPPWQTWMSAVGLFSLLASFGEYASPTWVARHSPRVARSIGEHDPAQVPVIRADGKLRDGDGGVYWALATFLPGFRQFRYPSKFLTFTAMGLAALASRGWDALVSGDPGYCRRLAGWSSTLLGLTALAFVVASVWGRGYLAGLGGRPQESIGPVDADGAFRDLLRGLIQGASTFAVALALAVRKGSVRFGPAIGLVVMAGDLALANAGLVATVPQRAFDEIPEALAIIERAEREHPLDGPFRVHRMPAWEPVGWSKSASNDREREFVDWERRTLQPKYGISLGLQYTLTIGAAELRDYRAFFRGSIRPVDPVTARSLHASTGEGVVFYPRRAFDLWNTRYFLVPSFPNKWSDPNRGFAAFLDRTELIHPAPDAFQGPGGREKFHEWIDSSDFQVRRNLAEFPRAWVVHRGVDVPSGRSRLDPSGVEEILFSEADRWRAPSQVVHDPRSVAWLEPGRRTALGPFLDGGVPGSRETVRVVRHESGRVELEARLDRPGLVVLADAFYPGWTLTVDGRAAPIERANRMMRAAAVGSGLHRLVFAYRPTSFRVGLVASCLSLAALVPLFWFASRQKIGRMAPNPPVVATSDRKFFTNNARTNHTR